MKTQQSKVYCAAELIQLALLLSKNALGRVSESQIADDVIQLIKLSAEHRNLSLKKCNDGNFFHILRNVKEVEDKITEICKPYGTPKFNGDPDDFTVSILFKSEDYNTEKKNQGWSIPVRL